MNRIDQKPTMVERSPAAGVRRTRRRPGSLFVLLLMAVGVLALLALELWQADFR